MATVMAIRCQAVDAFAATQPRVKNHNVSGEDHVSQSGLTPNTLKRTTSPIARNAVARANVVSFESIDYRNRAQRRKREQSPNQHLDEPEPSSREAVPWA